MVMMKSRAFYWPIKFNLAQRLRRPVSNENVAFGRLFLCNLYEPRLGRYAYYHFLLPGEGVNVFSLSQHSSVGKKAGGGMSLSSTLLFYSTCVTQRQGTHL